MDLNTVMKLFAILIFMQVFKVSNTTDFKLQINFYDSYKSFIK